MKDCITKNNSVLFLTAFKRGLAEFSVMLSAARRCSVVVTQVLIKCTVRFEDKYKSEECRLLGCGSYKNRRFGGTYHLGCFSCKLRYKVFLAC
jgi:hypothetical protein